MFSFFILSPAGSLTSSHFFVLVLKLLEVVSGVWRRQQNHEIASPAVMEREVPSVTQRVKFGSEEWIWNLGIERCFPLEGMA